MSDVLDFMSRNPYLTFFLALIAGQCVIAAIKYPLRFMSIRKHGWPPPHCDADGDFRDNEDGENGCSCGCDCER